MNDMYMFFTFLIFCVPFSLIWVKLYKSIKADLVTPLNYCFLIIGSLFAFYIYATILGLGLIKIASNNLGNPILKEIKTCSIMIGYLVGIYSVFIILIVLIIAAVIAISNKLTKRS
jgi:hypothetical protein